MTDDERNRYGKSGSTSKLPNEVGYKRPPVHTRFQKGKSGNPNGRPRGDHNINELLRREFDKTIPVREGAQTKRMTKKNAMVQNLSSRAAGGDLKAIKLVSDLTDGMQWDPELPSKIDFTVRFVRPGDVER